MTNQFIIKRNIFQKLCFQKYICLLVQPLTYIFNLKLKNGGIITDKRQTVIFACGIFLISLFAAGCLQDTAPEANELVLTFDGLEPLEEGYYEGWAIFGEEKVSTGTFNMGDELSFAAPENIGEADAIVITIEPEDDADPEPSGIVILQGDLSEGSADLEFPVDLSGASGSYILATPTNGPDTDENSGIWFLQLPEPPTPGLELPELPDGWVYEGWAVFEGTPLTSGKFTAVDEVDGFDGFSGVEPGPPFPGEDYLVNAPMGVTFPIDLGDGESLVVISIEPDMDGVDPTGEGPFQIKPLVGEVPAGAQDHENYPMILSLDSIPSGTATIA